MNGSQQHTAAAAAEPSPPTSGSARTRTRTLSSTAAPAAIDTSPQALYKHQKHLQPDQGIVDPGSPSTQALDRIMSNLAEQQQQQQQQQNHHLHQQQQVQQQQQQQQLHHQNQNQQHQLLYLNSAIAAGSTTQSNISTNSANSAGNLKRNSSPSLQTLALQSSQPSSSLSHSPSDTPSSATAYINSTGSAYSSAASTPVGSDTFNLTAYSVGGHHLSQLQHLHLAVPNTPPPYTTSFGVTGDASGSAISNSNPLQHRPHTPLKSSFPSSISSDHPESPSATINFDAVSTGQSPSSHYKPFSSAKPGRKHHMGSEKHMGSLPTIHYQNGRGRRKWHCPLFFLFFPFPCLCSSSLIYCPDREYCHVDQKEEKRRGGGGVGPM